MMLTSREDQHDILTVCDWGQKLSYYHLNGKQVVYMLGHVYITGHVGWVHCSDEQTIDIRYV